MTLNIKKAVFWTVFASALVCAGSDYVAQRELQRLDSDAIVTVGYPALDNCQDDQECGEACAEAYKAGLIESLSECEY